MDTAARNRATSLARYYRLKAAGQIDHRSVKGRWCACGRPAVAYRFSAYVCQRCAILEANMDDYHPITYDTADNLIDFNPTPPPYSDASNWFTVADPRVRVAIGLE